MELNDKQKAIVEAPIDRPAKVVAGAGTGKTRVLVERYLRFLRDGVPPSRLLALTFTLKSADEMRKRIFEEAERDHPELLRELYSAWIMNFHSFGFRVIRENGPAFGIDPGVDVASEAELRRIDRTLSSRFLAGRIEGVPTDFGGAIPPPTGLDSLFGVYLGVVKKCRGDLIPVQNLLDSIRDDDTGPYRAAVASISALYDAFVDEMERHNLIDFSDMIARAASGLAGDPDLTAQYRRRFDHILVDEFQDTSAAQFELLKVLSDERYSKVTVVGDEKQSIYRWRDARVENIRDFPGDELELSENYRSRQNILDIAHAFVAMDPALAGRAFRLEADREAPPKPIVLFHPDEEHDGQQNDIESAALAAWVVHLTGGPPLPGVPALVGGDSGDKAIGYGDIAVLLRGVREYRVVPSIERAFQTAGIPYVILGGADAAGSRALESLYAYLSLLIPGDHRIGLLHALESKPFEIGHAALAELFGQDGLQPGDRRELLSDDRVARVTDTTARERVLVLRSILDSLDDARASMDFRSFLSRAIEDTPFLVRMFAEGATARSVEDLVGDLWGICNTLDSKRELGLWSFLDHLRAAIDGRSFGKVEQVAVRPNRVRIMTIHQAKGLEFPAVAVAGIKQSQNESSGFFLSRTDGVFTEKWKDWNRGYKDTDERELEKEMGRQEERCLLYVAMTRARDFLFMSTPYADPHKSFFGDVLAAAGEGGIPNVVIRNTPTGVRTVVPAEQAAVPAAEAVAAVVSEWQGTREALARQLASPLSTPDSLQFVNWTALKAFADCPLQFRFRYVLGLGNLFGNEETSSASPAAEKGDSIDSIHIPRGIKPVQYGLLVHELLRAFTETRAGGGEPGDGWIESVVGQSMARAKNRRGIVDGASKIIDAFASSAISVPGTVMKLEEPFQVRFDRTVYHGVFDRVEKDDGGWMVTDYKIGQEKVEYGFQVAFYAWALGRITGGEKAKGRLCYLRESGLKLVEVSPMDLDGLAGELERHLSDGAFAASPGDACRDCPYKTACPDSGR